MTAPLTPASCDLRGLPFMPLDVVRIRESDLTALSTGDEFKAAVLLWCASWNQLPAASLPCDDRILGRLAGLSAREWTAVKATALRGWVLCDDGRIYHPVVAEKALEAWAARERQRARINGRWDRERARRAQEASSEGDHVDTVVSSTVHTAEHSAEVQGTGRGKEVREEISAASAASGVSKPSTPVTPLRQAEVQKAFEAWNDLATRLHLPKAQKLDAGRQKAIRARLADGGLEGWSLALAAVERSKLCKGENDRSWRADLDFVCQPKSWRRLREGFYGGDAPTATDHRPEPWRGPLDLRAAVVASQGDDFAINYLDPCTWQEVPDRQIKPRTAFAAKQLEREVGAILRQAGVTIEVERAA